MALHLNEDLSDADLAGRIGSGSDSEAEAELFRRMAPRIRLYGLRHLLFEFAFWRGVGAPLKE